MSSDAAGIKAGVLLCERPTVKLQPSASGSAVFINHASPLEKLDRQGLGLGLNPIRKVHVMNRTRKVSKPSALDKHRRHVALLQRANRERQANALLQGEQDAAAHGALSAFSAQLRSAILSGEDVSDMWAPAAQAEAVRQQQIDATCTVRDLRASLPKILDADTLRSHALQQQQQQRRQALEIELGDEQQQQQLACELEGFVEQALQEAATRAAGGIDGLPSSSAAVSRAAERQGAEASSSGQAIVQQTRPGTSCSTRSGKASKARPKPAWALTEEQAADEAAAEEDELLSFADDLDWNEFVDQLDDTELQTAFQALQAADKGAGAAGSGGKEWRKCFVRAMNHIAMKDVAAAAQGSNRLAGGGSDAGDDAASDGGHSTFSRATAASKQHAEGAAARRAALLQRLGAASGWDACTRVGDGNDTGEAATKAKDAAEFLKDNPDVRSVHSAASVRSLLLRTAEPEGQ